MNPEIIKTCLTELKVFGSPASNESLHREWTELRQYLSASCRMYNDIDIDEEAKEIRIGVYGGFPSRVVKLIGKLAKSDTCVFDTDESVTVEAGLYDTGKHRNVDAIAAVLSGISYSDSTGQIIFKYTNLTEHPTDSVFMKAAS
jgi:hypothetical protein